MSQTLDPLAFPNERIANEWIAVFEREYPRFVLVKSLLQDPNQKISGEPGEHGDQPAGRVGASNLGCWHGTSAPWLPGLGGFLDGKLVDNLLKHLENLWKIGEYWR